jgi:hypothetical protein
MEIPRVCATVGETVNRRTASIEIKVFMMPVLKDDGRIEKVDQVVSKPSLGRRSMKCSGGCLS